MTMQGEAIMQAVREKPAVLLLFGGAHCQVCQVLKPRLEAMLAERFPQVEMVYVDCAEMQDLCAQEGVFSLPVARVYFDGQRMGEWVRAFSPAQVAQALERPYRLMFG